MNSILRRVSYELWLRRFWNTQGGSTYFVVSEERNWTALASSKRTSSDGLSPTFQSAPTSWPWLGTELPTSAVATLRDWQASVSNGDTEANRSWSMRGQCS